MRDAFVPTAEAAFIAGITDREMNRAVDEHILPEPLVRGGGTRLFAPLGAAFARFYFGTEGIYVAGFRRQVLAELMARLRSVDTKSAEAIYGLRTNPRDGWHIDVHFATGPLKSIPVDLGLFVSRSRECIGQIDQAESLITTDAEVMGGVPIIAGTRVPVDIIAASLDEGSTVEEILAAYPYPGLTKDHIEAARVYARVHPRRGRPAKPADINPDLKIRSTRRIEPNQRRRDA